MKITNTLVLIFALGVATEAFLIRPHPAAAQQSRMVPVYIHAVSVNGDQGAVANLPNLHIVGISCLPKPLKNAPDMAVCYVATTLEGN